MAPTPFTAAEIRLGCTPGRTVTFRVTEGTGPPRIETTRFVSCDEQGALMEKTVRDREGSLVTDQRSFTATWGDLQWHAAFEASRTSVTNESLVSEMGVFDCLRYTVRGEDGTADYWFAIELPGMPVRVRAPGLEMDVLENIN